MLYDTYAILYYTILTYAISYCTVLYNLKHDVEWLKTKRFPLSGGSARRLNVLPEVAVMKTGAGAREVLTDGYVIDILKDMRTA